MRLLRTIVSTCLAGRLPWNYGPIGHLQIQKSIWPSVLSTGCGIAVDATCGNGHDSELLVKLLRMDCPALGKSGVSELYCIDIQELALQNTSKRLSDVVHPDCWNNVHFVHDSHVKFPSSIQQNSVSLICYNLGYLPGPKRLDGDFIQTSADSTLESINNAIPLLQEEGLLSITAYPGNTGGKEEMNVVEERLAALPESEWRVYQHRPVNRPLSPHLFLAFRIGKPQRSLLT